MPGGALIVASAVLTVVTGILTNIIVSAPSVIVAALLVISICVTVVLEQRKPVRGRAETSEAPDDEAGDPPSRSAGNRLVAVLYHVGQVAIILLVIIGFVGTLVFTSIRYVHARSERRKLIERAAAATAEAAPAPEFREEPALTLTPLPPIFPDAPYNVFAWRGAAGVILMMLSVLFHPSSATSGVAPSKVVYFSDDFSTPSSEWTQVRGPQTSVLYDRGQLVLTSANSAPLRLSAPAFTRDTDPDTAVDITFTMSGDDRTGEIALLCRDHGAGSTETYYALAIRADGYTQVRKRLADGEVTELLPWTAPPGINPAGPNHVRFACRTPYENRVSFSVKINAGSLTVPSDEDFSGQGELLLGGTVALSLRSSAGHELDVAIDDIQLSSN